MKKKLVSIIALGCLLAGVFCSESCAGKAEGERATEANDSIRTAQLKARLIGSFNADSAYNHIARQVEFGPRVPGTPGHANCRQYILDCLEAYAADTVLIQDAEVEAYTGDILPITNIMARYNPGKDRRVLLVAHWDTRPWADNEPDQARRLQPIDGANDGGSGVGVLLEIARNFSLRDPEIGVDLLFVDAEDYGNTSGFSNNDDTWCLGSRYWVENMPYDGVLPAYGILLDMVGGKNARFHHEMYSLNAAQSPTIKIWSEAKHLGYDDIFLNSPGGAVIDDHVVISEAGIPTTDIIESLNERTGTFPSTWHTHLDDLSNIDTRSLEAVGNTVLNVIYKEK